MATQISQAVAPLSNAVQPPRADGRRFTDRLTLSDWAERTGRVLEAVTVSESGDLSVLWLGEAGERLASLLSDIMTTMDRSKPMDSSGSIFLQP